MDATNTELAYLYSSKDVFQNLCLSGKPTTHRINFSARCVLLGCYGAVCLNTSVHSLSASFPSWCCSPQGLYLTEYQRIRAIVKVQLYLLIILKPDENADLQRYKLHFCCTVSTTVQLQQLTIVYQKYFRTSLWWNWMLQVTSTIFFESKGSNKNSYIPVSVTKSMCKL